MLVICNGAIKSGSTWLYNILCELVEFSHPPERYLTMRNPRHPCIRPELLEEFLATEDYRGRHYVSKNHLGRSEHRKLLADRPHVRVVGIERDPRDVLVSNYYHDCFRNGYQGEFAQWYWQAGRDVAAALAGYRNLWRGAAANVYISSYEALQAEFRTEVQRIAAGLGIDLDDAAADRIRGGTSLDALRAQYRDEPRFEGEKFFRKGTVGDWRNHFDGAMLRDLTRIERRGIGRFDLPRLRNRIRSALNRRPVAARGAADE